MGTFQFFAARERWKGPPAGRLCHQPPFPEIAARDDKYLEFFRRVREAQASLIAQWVHVGFVHGVMNTDNTTISGETIDYGPCAFIDAYDPKAVFQFHRRTRTLLPPLAPAADHAVEPVTLRRDVDRLVNPDDSEDAVRQLTNEIMRSQPITRMLWLKGMRAKLGLFKELPGDPELANDLCQQLKIGGGLHKPVSGHGAFVRGNVTSVRALLQILRALMLGWIVT